MEAQGDYTGYVEDYRKLEATYRSCPPFMNKQKLLKLEIFIVCLPVIFLGKIPLYFPTL